MPGDFRHVRASKPTTTNIAHDFALKFIPYMWEADQIVQLACNPAHPAGTNSSKDVHMEVYRSFVAGSQIGHSAAYWAASYDNTFSRQAV